VVIVNLLIFAAITSTVVIAIRRRRRQQLVRGTVLVPNDHYGHSPAFGRLSSSADATSMPFIQRGGGGVAADATSPPDYAPVSQLPYAYARSLTRLRSCR
jgi:hypothetical protein